MHFCRRIGSFHMPLSYQSTTVLLSKHWTTSFTSSSLLKCILDKCSFNFGNRRKSLGAKSRHRVGRWWCPMQTVAGELQFGGQRGVERCGGECLRPCSTFLFSGLNCSPEFCQCLTIPVSIYCFPSSHEIGQQYPLSIPKHSCHDSTCWLCLLEFSQSRRWGMQQLMWLLFRLRCVVICPGYVACDNWIKKLSSSSA